MYNILYLMLTTISRPGHVKTTIPGGFPRSATTKNGSQGCTLASVIPAVRLNHKERIKGKVREKSSRVFKVHTVAESKHCRSGEKTVREANNVAFIFHVPLTLGMVQCFRLQTFLSTKIVR